MATRRDASARDLGFQVRAAVASIGCQSIPRHRKLAELGLDMSDFSLLMGWVRLQLEMKLPFHEVCLWETMEDFFQAARTHTTVRWSESQEELLRSMVGDVLPHKMTGEMTLELFGYEGYEREQLAAVLSEHVPGPIPADEYLNWETVRDVVYYVTIYLKR